MPEADHLEPGKVEKLIARIRREQGGLDLLVNDISESAEHEFGKTFWQTDLDRGFAMFRNAVHTHIITSHIAAPLLIDSASGKVKSTGFVSVTPTGLPGVGTLTVQRTRCPRSPAPPFCAGLM